MRTRSEQRTEPWWIAVLNGEARASAGQRAGAFSNVGIPPPLHALIGKVTLVHDPLGLASAETMRRPALYLSLSPTCW